MSSLLAAELVATCNSLGYFNVQENKYYADANTVESVKDLIRYLRRDDESHDIRRLLGDTKVVQTDLLPLMKTYWEQTDLFDVLLRLLVNLTTPALMLWNEEMPTDRTARQQYLQIEEHLRLYKQAFADEGVWAVLSARISKILEVESSERLEETGLIIERILILVRNILHVPCDPDAERRPDNDASVHDQVLWGLHQSGMLDIILYISSANEKSYYMHIIEIMCYMLREQNAMELASAALQRSVNEKMRDEAELLAILHKENTSKREKAKVYRGTRHSRFGGTYVVSSLKSISDNELIYHKPLTKLEEINFDGGKRKAKTPKNRAPFKDHHVERRSAFSIRLFLKEFCVEFLNGAYNTFMFVVKQRLTRQQAQKHDETYYLWALRFFLEFNRGNKCDVKLVSETLSVDAFQYVQRQLENHSEMMVSDKKNVLLWSKRLHMALLAYRELLKSLLAMETSPDESVRASAKVIKSNIFYVLEYRELVLHLMVLYNECTMSAEYLKDLLETQHVFLKMFENYCSGKVIMVEERGKKKKKPAKKSKKVNQPSVDLEALWEEVHPKLLVYLDEGESVREEMQWKVNSHIKQCMPEEGEEQLSDLLGLGVQRKVLNGELEEAVALMLEARSLYPGLIGTPEDASIELLEFHKVFFTTVERGLQNQPANDADEEDAEEMRDEEDALGEEYDRVQESDLKFDDFIKRLAHPKIVRACALALARFDANTVVTNHCIVKLLHRIAFDCKMPAMLFQVSIFRTFQDIYKAKSLPQNKELVKFATYIIRQFYTISEVNKTVFMEALFWKTSRDAFDIEEGYGSYQEKSKAATQTWTEYEEDELRRLFVEHQEQRIERDVVDWLVDNLVNTTRTRRAVLKKLKELYLLTDYKASGKSSGPPKQWTPEEEAQLRELYEQFKEAMDPLTCIMDRLAGKRPKQRIVDKLLEMQVVEDRKQLRKKRTMNGKSTSKNVFEYVGRDVPSEGSSWDSDSSADNDATQKLPQTVNRPKSASARSKRCKHKPLPRRDIIKMLIDLASGELNQGLDWLKESLEDAAEDWEEDEDDNDGVPLVPILDCSIAAMQSAEFLSLLSALGLKAPTQDGQEAYWRIPPTLALADLQECVELLKRALEGKLSLDEEKENAPLVEDKTGKGKMRDLIKKIAATKTNRSGAELQIEGLDDTTPNQSQSSHSSQKRRIVIESSSSSEDEDEDNLMIADDESHRMSFKPTRIHDFDEDNSNANESSSRKDDSPKELFRSARFISDSEEESNNESENDLNRKPPPGQDNLQPDEDDDDGIPLRRCEGKTDLLGEEEVAGAGDESKRPRSASDSDEDQQRVKPETKRVRRILSSDEEDD